VSFTVLSRAAELRRIRRSNACGDQRRECPASRTSRFLRLLPYVVILAITVCLLAFTYLLLVADDVPQGERAPCKRLT